MAGFELDALANGTKQLGGDLGSAAQMQREIQVAGRPVSTYTYPGTSHWFFEQNRPEYDVAAAQLAWERTTTFLHEQLD